MYKRIKKAIATALAVVSLNASAIAGDWYRVQPSVVSGRVATRIEGSRGPVYGFADLDSESAYMELRANYDLSKRVGVAVELNASDSEGDTLRLGLTLRPRLLDFTQFKILPFDTGDKGAQLCVYTEKKAGKCKFSFLTDYNVDPKTVYGEFRIEVPLDEGVNVFVGERFFGRPGNLEDIVEFGLSIDL